MGETDALLQDAHRFGPAAPDEEYVYGACAPGWHSAAAHETCVEQWISEMQSMGIERVCCLVAAGEESGTNLAAYRESFGDRQTLHAPIPHSRLAEPEGLEGEILPFLDEAVAEDEPVVIHCLSGLGRTGQVLAAWLVYDRGYHPETAIEVVRQVGRDPMDAIRRGNATEEELLALLAEFLE